MPVFGAHRLMAGGGVAPAFVCVRARGDSMQCGDATGKRGQRQLPSKFWEIAGASTFRGRRCRWEVQVPRRRALRARVQAARARRSPRQAAHTAPCGGGTVHPYSTCNAADARGGHHLSQPLAWLDAVTGTVAHTAVSARAQRTNRRTRGLRAVRDYSSLYMALSGPKMGNRGTRSRWQPYCGYFKL